MRLRAAVAAPGTTAATGGAHAHPRCSYPPHARLPSAPPARLPSAQIRRFLETGFITEQEGEGMGYGGRSPAAVAAAAAKPKTKAATEAAKFM